jgi:hypothetical protein
MEIRSYVLLSKPQSPGDVVPPEITISLPLGAFILSVETEPHPENGLGPEKPDLVCLYTIVDPSPEATNAQAREDGQRRLVIVPTHSTLTREDLLKLRYIRSVFWVGKAYHIFEEKQIKVVNYTQGQISAAPAAPTMPPSDPRAAAAAQMTRAAQAGQVLHQPAPSSTGQRTMQPAASGVPQATQATAATQQRPRTGERWTERRPSNAKTQNWYNVTFAHGHLQVLTNVSGGIPRDRALSLISWLIVLGDFSDEEITEACLGVTEALREQR